MPSQAQMDVRDSVTFPIIGANVCVTLVCPVKHMMPDRDDNYTSQMHCTVGVSLSKCCSSYIFVAMLAAPASLMPQDML